MSSPIRLQRNATILAVGLLLMKLLAWYWTRSVAIYTDALESIVNVVAGFIGLYSLWLAAKPRDQNHPYGHGKVEFISASIEGTLITVAGLLIIYEGFLRLRKPTAIERLDWGLLLLATTAVLNFAMGSYMKRKGLERRSMTLEAAGKHLMTDTYSTVGVIAGLLVMWLTGWYWLDVAIAFAMAALILVAGYRVVRKSLAGIMDEADLALLKKMIEYLQEIRGNHPAWIDIHNLRMVQYGQILHLDGHITLPWYFTVQEAHQEIQELTTIIHEKFGNKIELFLHADYCKEFSCSICRLQSCRVRQHPQTHMIPWTLENVMQNRRHNAEAALAGKKPEQEP